MFLGLYQTSLHYVLAPAHLQLSLWNLLVHTEHLYVHVRCIAYNTNQDLKLVGPTRVKADR